MKKSLFITSFIVLCIAMVSCGGNSKKANNPENDKLATITVDEVLANSDALVDDTLAIEGTCSHLCRHGGKKAFVAGSADSVMLRCEAFSIMGEPFPKTVIGHKIQVNGILREERIDEDAIVKMEKQNAERLEKIAMEQGTESAELASRAASGCDTERTAQGQKDITEFNERMADYRARIAERQAKESKAYLSFYYLDAISYKTLN